MPALATFTFWQEKIADISYLTQFKMKLSFVLSISIISLHLCSAAVVKYSLEIAYFSGSPDGIHRENGILGINGQFPGPTIEANVGDTLEITVINSIQDGQNTSMHWHGMYQKGSQFEDGAAMITQCPIPAGASQVYRFNVTQAGTFWYHSHVNSQYTEGMLGALIVHGTPEFHSYDGGEFTVTLSDWYHRRAFENEHWHLSPGSNGVPPYPDSGLINGMGRYPCQFAGVQNRSCDTTKQFRPVIRINKDKTYRVRLINAAAVAAFNFSIDSHILNTIEVDGMDVARPVAADIVPIAAGQRYSFLIKCPENITSGHRFLIRADVRKENLLLSSAVPNINRYPNALMGDATAVLECHDEDFALFDKQVETTSERFSCNDIVPPFHKTEVEYLNETALVPFDEIPAPEEVDERFTLSAVFNEDHENIRRGSFNYTPFVLPHDKPLLMTLIDGEEIPQSAFPLEIEYGSVVELVINNPFFGPHPFHLHGHHFWVLGTGPWYDGDYDPSRHNLTRFGVKRDTVLVQEQSWAVIRFVADNPGIWTFHCHIDWHNLSGMSLVFIEGADIVKSETKIPDEAKRVCELHKGIKNEGSEIQESIQNYRRSLQHSNSHHVHIGGADWYHG